MNWIKKAISRFSSWHSFFRYANKLTEKEKGDLFEHLTYLVLLTKPEYSSKIKNIWLHGKGMPANVREKLNLPTTDEGIDLVAETQEGEFWAIQCKFKGRNQAPTVREIGTFLNLANNVCRHISFALLVHTGERGIRKKKLAGAKYSEIGLEFWLGLGKEDWQRIRQSLNKRPSRPQRRKPRSHQAKAIAAAKSHFKLASRGRLIMPCGTGKSLTAFWIAHSLKAKSVIVAVPSLSLIKQSLEDWTKEFLAIKEVPRPEWLVVCGDESTGRVEKDEFVSDTYSLGIPTTTDTSVISEFLKEKHPGRKVIFTTYQSSGRLAAAARKSRFRFDLAILDEAHKTVGEKSKAFSTLLSDRNIQVKKRMFMTATERVVRGRNDDVYSMDDEQIYGKQFYLLTFKEAIQSKPAIISDYKILTITVTSQEIRQHIARNKLLTDKSRKLEEQEAQSMAASIALRKATRKYGIRHAISFHRSIRAAEDFAILNDKLNRAGLDRIKLSSHHISSKKSAGERARLMEDFKSEKLALMTNARCLTEGVDVPAIDCVLFADPKQSVVDIVQAAGRALRPHSGKKFGYIMIPLIVPDGMKMEDFVETTPFRQVGKIITALSTQDERIAEEFRINTKGRKLRSSSRIIIDGSVHVGLKVDFASLADTINARIWEKVAKANWRSFEKAREYVHSLNLKNNREWRIYATSEKRALDIPTAPEVIYKNNGWIGYGNWLGTGVIAPRLIKYRPFAEAKKYIHSLGLKTTNDWNVYCKSGLKPDDIPATPRSTYINKGWVSMGDWLGTGMIANFNRKYRSFIRARSFARSLKLKSGWEWREFCKSQRKPDDIPANPNQTYKTKGWVSMGDWLGTGIIAHYNKKYRPFIEARKFVHSLKLNSSSEWKKYCKSGSKPDDIPFHADRTYENKGWKGMGDWLGTGRIADHLKRFRAFAEARKFVWSLKLETETEWREYCKSGRKPADIPASPAKSYKNSGWKGIGDWLGTGNIANFNRKYRPFKQARSFVRSLKLNSGADWIKYCRSGKKPLDIPAEPSRTYKTMGWVSMGDWLGTGRIATQSIKYRPFVKARKFARSLKLKSGSEWKEFCKSQRKPEDIPADPYQTYKTRGWVSMGDWLGTGRIAARLVQYRSFEQAKKYVRKLNLNSREDWEQYCRSGKKPSDIPGAPHHVYKNSGWKGMADWLGYK